jgi:hypothetical protein
MPTVRPVALRLCGPDTAEMARWGHVGIQTLLPVHGRAGMTGPEVAGRAATMDREAGGKGLRRITVVVAAVSLRALQLLQLRAILVATLELSPVAAPAVARSRCRSRNYGS